MLMAIEFESSRWEKVYRDSVVDDYAFVLSLAYGDELASRQAFGYFSPLVRRILRRALGPGIDVEDLVQEVFLRFFENVGALRKADALRGYVIAITVNTLRDELRRRQVRRILRFVDPVELPKLRAVEMDFEAREALERFYRIIERLRLGDRIAFVLHIIEELPLSEVAAALDVSVPTAKRRVERARTRVSRQVESDPVLSNYAARGCTMPKSDVIESWRGKREVSRG